MTLDALTIFHETAHEVGDNAMDGAPEVRPDIVQALASGLMDTYGRYSRDLVGVAYRAWLANGHDVPKAAATAIDEEA